MNNARMWTIVNPTVGVPLFLIGVMITSLYIHFQVLTRTAWFEGYLAPNIDPTGQVVQK